MLRHKFTPEVFVKSTSAFLFGFTIGYFVFSLVAKPNENTVFAETETTSEAEANPTSTTSFPKTYSDLDFPELSPEDALTHQQKPVFDHIYDYAKYYVYYPQRTQTYIQTEKPEEPSSQDLPQNATLE